MSDAELPQATQLKLFEFTGYDSRKLYIASTSLKDAIAMCEALTDDIIQNIRCVMEPVLVDVAGAIMHATTHEDPIAAAARRNTAKAISEESYRSLTGMMQNFLEEAGMEPTQPAKKPTAGFKSTPKSAYQEGLFDALKEAMEDDN